MNQTSTMAGAVIATILGMTACNDDSGSSSDGGSADDGGEDGGDDGGDAGTGDGGGDGGDGGGDGGTGTEGGGETGPGGGYEVWELRIDEFAIKPIETDYVCFEWTANFSQLAHIVGMSPVIDNGAHVHHYVVDLLPAPTGRPQGYPCYDLNGSQIWVWTPGVTEYLLPPEAGLLVGDAAGGDVTIRIQVHYNNPLAVSGQRDSSGLDVYVSEELRANNAASLAVADVDGITIPPGEPAYEHLTTCTSADTNTILSGPINVFGSSLHAHEIGSVLFAEHWRGGELLAEFNRDDPFGFDMQTYTEVALTIEPGDEIVNHCIYDSTGRTEPTLGGVGTADEMCWNTLMYYPAENAVFDYCGM